MISILLIFITSFFIHIFLGIYILLQKSKGRATSFFVVSIILIGLMDLSGIVIQLMHDENVVVLLYKFSTIFSLFHILFTTFFIIEFTALLSLKKIHYILSLVPLVIFSVIIIMAPKFVDFMHYKNTWRFSQIEAGKLYIFSIYWIYYGVSLLLSIILLIQFYKRSVSIKLKRQSLIILTTYCITSILLICYMVLIIHIFSLIQYSIPGEGSLFFIIWGIGATVAILRYRFLSLNPNLVSDEILENIDELVFLINSKLQILYINDAVKSLFNNSIEIESIISDYIRESVNIAKEINTLMDGEVADFSSRIHFDVGKEEYLVDTKFKIIKDSFNDTVGILIIGKEVKEVKQLQHIYHITKREAEIIQHIIMATPNKDIAVMLDITENTLKRHVTNIYNKLNINNKVELINLLKDFNIIPEKKAERTVLLI